MTETDDEAKLRAALERDRSAVYAGTLVTAVATVALFVAPDLVAVDDLKQTIYETTGVWLAAENPFTVVRLFGGVPGAIVAGWLTSELGSGTVTGTKAAMYGLGLAYLLAVGFSILYWPLVGGIFPPPLFSVIVVPAINAIPMFGTYLVGGLLAGVVADSVSSTRY
ncbi:hypothetical protein OB955_21680 [Halobacteria archaeon AArc-m2/3/4]|uniref:Uncharacterized protein n=1 Tax=Natronoglomus mannanivorans TaxID=2979990 RepID=A0AAP2YZT2_9EURY|nr:hypothetical protein [Halobacteria archaeon AArc-xg1-1]MCU4975317.1 hypothetical protein [Halobacteria archaeon AArc-m2/3/4]